MISQAAEYSLRAILVLAAHPGAPLTAAELSTRARLPLGYFSKILQTLSRAGIVVSQRGREGGFLLAVPPSTLTLFDVISAVDPSRRVTACPIGLPEHSVRLCGLHRSLDEAAEAAERVYRSVTIAAALEGPEGGGCHGAEESVWPTIGRKAVGA